MAGRYDFTIEQGSTFRRVITWRDGAGNLVDLTGKTARMKIKDSRGVVIHSMANTSGIELGGVLGTITLAIPSSISTGLNFDTARYDLEIVTGSGESEDVKRLLEGVVSLDQETTS